MNEIFRLKEGETLTATFNDYVDLLMHNLDKMVIKAGLDPMAVPDMDLTISKVSVEIHKNCFIKLITKIFKFFQSIYRKF